MSAGEVAPKPQPGRGRRLFQWLSLFAIAAIPILLVASLAVPKSTCCSPSQPPLPGSPIEGVVVAVDSSGLGRVAGFSVRLGDGSTMAFELGALENPTEFPPGHLAGHLASSQPVRVFFGAEPTRLVVYRVEDASASPT